MNTLQSSPDRKTLCKLPLVVKMDIESRRFVEFCSKQYDLLGIQQYRRCSEKVGQNILTVREYNTRKSVELFGFNRRAQSHKQTVLSMYFKIISIYDASMYQLYKSFVDKYKVELSDIDNEFLDEYRKTHWLMEDIANSTVLDFIQKFHIRKEEIDRNV